MKETNSITTGRRPSWTLKETLASVLLAGTLSIGGPAVTQTSAAPTTESETTEAVETATIDDEVDRINGNELLRTADDDTTTDTTDTPNYITRSAVSAGAMQPYNVAGFDFNPFRPGPTGTLGVSGSVTETSTGVTAFGGVAGSYALGTPTSPDGTPIVHSAYTGLTTTLSGVDATVSVAGLQLGEDFGNRRLATASASLGTSVDLPVVGDFGASVKAKKAIYNQEGWIYTPSVSKDLSSVLDGLKASASAVFLDGYSGFDEWPHAVNVSLTKTGDFGPGSYEASVNYNVGDEVSSYTGPGFEVSYTMPLSGN